MKVSSLYYRDILRKYLSQRVNDVFGIHVPKEEIIIEKPKSAEHGSFALPCFQFAKLLKQAPVRIAEQLFEESHEAIGTFELVGPYINVHLNRATVTRAILHRINEEQSAYGTFEATNETVVFDYSSPNIAKPFSIGHLRSTIIGHALVQLYQKAGYETVGINYLGDWGTQFGKLVVAYEEWGDDEKIQKQPVEELLSLYIRFHDEATTNETLEVRAKEVFQKMESGDEYYLSLWKRFREDSLKESERIYELLGVSFDSYAGESFYNDKMDAVVEELKEKNLLVKDDGAYVVFYEDPNDHEQKPALIQKNDGSTLYLTRDLAAIDYRYTTYKFSKALYVVGNEQQYHFSQLREVVRRMGKPYTENFEHVNFGLVVQNGKKMSTRKGNIVKLEDVLNESIEKVYARIKDREDLEDKRRVARQVGVGAVVFNDLKTYRENSVEFNLEEILRFEGNTGPYVQYTNSRLRSLKTQLSYEENPIFPEEISEDLWMNIQLLYTFEERIAHAITKNDPSVIAKYAFDLAKQSNKLYAGTRMKGNTHEAFYRYVVGTISIVLEESLRLLGIESPEKI